MPGIDSVVKAKNDAGVPPNDPALKQRSKKRKRLAMDDNEIEFTNIREAKQPSRAAEGTVEDLSP